MSLAEALGRLKGVRAGAGYYVARCPAHDDRNASLSVREGEGGRLLFKCFAGCHYRAIVDAIDGRPWQRIFHLPTSDPRPMLDDTKRTEISLRIWRQSRPAQGTLVERYLSARGITISPSSSLRFHPSLKHPTGAYLPTMVAAVEAIDGRIVAIHRTFLKLDGSGKASVEPNKAMLGPCAGGAVRLAKPAAKLAVAEGIETALSIAQACPDLAIWAALSTSGLRALQLPELVREVIICADADPGGEHAALAAAAQFARSGRTVRIARPCGGANDYNDLLRGVVAGR